MNSYHPTKFLDTVLEVHNDNLLTSVYRKHNKIPTHWSSIAPKRYKRNTIKGDLYRSSRITSNFEEEKSTIRDRCKSAGYPPRFTESIIRDYESLKKNNADNSLIIPEYLFEEPKRTLLVEIPFCHENKAASKRFIHKFHTFTGNTLDYFIV